MRGILRMIGSGGVNPVWDGLQGYWNADSNPNDSKNSFNGVLTNGATYETGIINNGFSFDGVNDFVNIGDVLDIRLDSWTYNFWVKPTVVGAYVGLITKAPALNQQRWWIIINAGKVEFSIQTVVDERWQFTGNTTIVAGVETMISVVINRNGAVKIYVNAIEETVSAVRGSPIANDISSINAFDFNTTDNLAFGGFHVTLALYNGIMDEISIFKAIKTQSEITELYNGGAGLQYIP